MFGEVAQFLENARRATDIPSVKAALQITVSALGFQKYLYLSVDLPFTRRQKPTTVSNYPSDWLDKYIQEERYLADPNLRVAMQDVHPFDWRDLRRHRNLTIKEQAFLDDAASQQLTQGLTVPIHGPGPVCAFLNLVTDHCCTVNESVRDYNKHCSHLLALNLHSVLRRLLGLSWEDSRLASLTGREMECLLWAARGKTSWETALILEVSEVTVNFHLTNAMKKLDVYSRAHAVAKAVAFGLICV